MSHDTQEGLNEKQQKALDYIISGKNIFLTGPSGTGKSHIIHTLKSHFGGRKKIAITSTTGISALIIGGTTLHSYLGIGLGQGSVESLHKKIIMNRKAKDRWQKLDILVIDEVSMLSPELFDKLEQIARLIRYPRKRLLAQPGEIEKPFGGIQLVLSGDFLQLPVVGCEDFCFESKSWENCIHHTVVLTEIMRQADKEFQEVLNDLRFGKITDRARALLESRIGVELKNDLGIKPTRIYTTNALVDEMNEKELDKLAEKYDFFEYDMDIYFYDFVSNREQAIEKYRKSSLAPDKLQLCKEAQVMLLHNLDLDSGLANGSRGVVEDFLEGLPIVKFLNGESRVIDFHSWEVEEGDKKVVRLTQIPLKLAWAITTHKCVSKNTLIPTEKGLQRIQDFSPVGQRRCTSSEINVKVQGINGLETASHIFKGEDEKTVIITTELGYTIEGSFRHPILLGTKQWRLLPELVIGDSIVLRSGSGCFGTNIGYINDIPLDILQGTREQQIVFLESIGLNLTAGAKFTSSEQPLLEDIQVILLNMGVISVIDKNTICILRNHNGFFCDTIKNIRYSETQLYDITVPGSHTFIGNGIVNHNSQGATLDYAEIDLSNIFAHGQGYVALSRVKTKEGISIIEINLDGIRAHPKAIEFYKKMT